MCKQRWTKVYHPGQVSTALRVHPLHRRVRWAASIRRPAGRPWPTAPPAPPATSVTAAPWRSRLDPADQVRWSGITNGVWCQRIEPWRCLSSPACLPQDISVPWDPPSRLPSPGLMEMFVARDTFVLGVVGLPNPVLLGASSPSLKLLPSLTATVAPRANTASVLEAHGRQVGISPGKGSRYYPCWMSVEG